MSIRYHQVKHLCLRKHLHGARGNLTAKRLVTAEQKLLSGLSGRVKGSGNLRAAERAISKQAAILARKRDSLRDALIDDVRAHFGEPVNVCFTRAEIAAFDRVVEQAINTVAVVLIIFRCIDSTLCGDRLCTTG